MIQHRFALNSPSGMKHYFVYLLASQSGVLYTGVTNNLIRRVGMHKRGALDGFTARYHVSRLVYYETFTQIRAAIRREKQIKNWSREKKIKLIESKNPKWADLWDSLVVRR